MLLALGVVAATVAGSVVSGTLVGIRGFDTAREEWVKGSKSFSSEEDLHLRATAYDLTSAAVEGETLPPHALQAARRLQ